MARVKWVHERLERWAAWRESDERKSRGYPSKCPMFREVKQDGYRELLVPLTNEEESATDAAVQSMRAGYPELHATVMLYYVNGRKTAAERAQILCCSEAAVRARLERIDAYLIQWLSDRAQEHKARVQASA